MNIFRTSRSRAPLVLSITGAFALAAVLLLSGLAAAVRQPQGARAAGGPEKLAEGLVSTGEEYGPAFTPDGKTLYFARRKEGRRSAAILVSQLGSGGWGAPQVAPFSGQHFDVEPFISPDGSKLFFASKRPAAAGGVPNKDFDLWVVERTAAGWGSPRPLEGVNSAGYDNYPAVTADGTLYFGSRREGGHGDVDLYRARLVGGRYAAPENLGAALNTPSDDADPFVAPDGSYIIFSSDRPGGLGEGDLYVSFNREGVWSAPRNLGEKVNSKEWDYTPLVSRDGRLLFFSRGWGDIYQIETAALGLSLKPR